MGFLIITEQLKIEDVVSQVRVVNQFPTSIRIYDRIFPVANKSELISLINGLEVGFYLGLDFKE